jgi:hypothetical protein
MGCYGNQRWNIRSVKIGENFISSKGAFIIYLVGGLILFHKLWVFNIYLKNNKRYSQEEKNKHTCIIYFQLNLKSDSLIHKINTPGKKYSDMQIIRNIISHMHDMEINKIFFLTMTKWKVFASPPF